ncbi:hypothetical protein SO802_005523 [Lithocarpus litseifolius]|uniref:RNase H type-1 domain-containing protein n=1 Tax=Lithocarpus litseifolius TaxID=425828 RepID=A0AAW2DM74_9ROSI
MLRAMVPALVVEETVALSSVLQAMVLAMVAEETVAMSSVLPAMVLAEVTKEMVALSSVVPLVVQAVVLADFHHIANDTSVDSLFEISERTPELDGASGARTSYRQKACLHVLRESISTVSKGQQIAIQVRWNKPPVGLFKLNADGASFGNPGKAGGGGLIRDHHGSWVKGYMRHIKFASSITADFWALKDELMLATQLGISQLLVELDAKMVVDLMLYLILQIPLITPFLLCSMIAGTSFANSTKLGSTMFIGKRIDA